MQRQQIHGAARGRARKHVAERHRLGHQVSVRQRDGALPPTGARGEEDEGGVAGVRGSKWAPFRSLHPRSSRRGEQPRRSVEKERLCPQPLGCRQQALADGEEACLCPLDTRGVAIRASERVERDDHRPAAQKSEAGCDPAGPVLAQQSHRFRGLDARGGEGTCGLPGKQIEPGEAERIGRLAWDCPALPPACPRIGRTVTVEACGEQDDLREGARRAHRAHSQPASGA